MRTVSLVLRQVRYEQKVFWRTPAAAFFTVVFPVVLLVVFATLNRGLRVTSIGGLRFVQYYVPAMAAFGIVTACYANLAGRFVYRRESGLLQRVRATPLPLAVLVSAFVLNALVVAVLVTTFNIAIGALLYGVAIPARWPVFVLVLAVGSLAFSAIAVAVASFIPSVDTVDAAVWGTFLPLAFVSGTFFPIPSSSSLARLAAVFPVQHLVQGSFAVFDTRRVGTTVPWVHLGVVAAWGVAACLVALRRFRWEPSVR